MSWIGDWVQQKAAEYLKAGVQAGGTLAGNAVGGVGSLVEDSGRSLGQGAAGGIYAVGDYINGYGANIKNSLSADGPVYNAPTSVPSRSAATNQTRALGPRLKTTNKSLSSEARTAPSSTTAKSRTSASPKVSRSRASSHMTNANKMPKSSPIGKKKEPPAAERIRPPISTSLSERSPSGKVKISTASRPRPLPNAGNREKSSRNDHTSTRQVRKAPTSDSKQSRARSDGKVVVSAASRPDC